MGAQLALLAVAVWTAWRPAETTTATPLVLATVLLVLAPWAWRRSDDPRRGAAAALLLALALAASGLAGSDPGGVVAAGALAAAVAALVWIASRERPPSWGPTVLALGLAALGGWAIWQVAAGFEQARPALSELPEALRAAAATRLASGRAFASLTVPGHLAALLATTLPLLVEAAGRRRWRLAAGVGLALALAGIVLSRSVLGAGLGLAAVAALTLARRRVWGLVAGVAAALALLGVALLRPDLRAFEPLTLRLDNWRTAAWTLDGTPLAGVGFGGYGQASQGVPFAVGNLPLHPHCVPLEWVVELGAAGALLAVAAVLALAMLLVRVWRTRPALAVAVAVIPVHSLVDFSLNTTGVAVPWAVLAGWALAGTGVRRRAEASAPAADHRGRWLVIAAGAAGIAGAALAFTSVEVGRAAAAATTAGSRFQGWQRALELAPWRDEPLHRMAEAALESRDPRLLAEADAVLERWRWLRPRSATLADLRARVATAQHRLPEAFAEAWEAAQARPREPRFGEVLDALERRFAPPNAPGTPGG